ncbi:hypothetical protein EON64_06800 [archaeon]|nr:MAG: hypothetical protein EON64_06800 [archaeon]
MSQPNIRCIGFCGVDDTVSSKLLILLSKHYPWVEWGLLFRSDLAGTGRYPTDQWVQSLLFTRDSLGVKMNLAAHLCRDRCQQIIEGDFNFIKHLAQQGFQRMQINATAANGVSVEAGRLSEYAGNIKAAAQSLGNVEFIFQYNTETTPIFERLLTAGIPSNVSILYDASCGKGVAIQSFPSPTLHPSTRCGYAGGIGPNTIDTVLTAVSEVAKTAPFPVWIDMESSLRASVGGNDEFSINSVMACVEIAVKQHGFPEYL